MTNLSHYQLCNVFFLSSSSYFFLLAITIITTRMMKMIITVITFIGIAVAPSSLVFQKYA